MTTRETVVKLKKQGVINSEIARRANISRERVSQILGKSPESENKRQARLVVKRALARKMIQKMPCVFCGSKDSQAHHSDYSKPLDIVWVCKKHHNKIHNPNAKSKFSPPRSIRRSTDFEAELAKAFDKNPDINPDRHGAFSTLMLRVVTFYNKNVKVGK